MHTIKLMHTPTPQDSTNTPLHKWTPQTIKTREHFTLASGGGLVYSEQDTVPVSYCE